MTNINPMESFEHIVLKTKHLTLRPLAEIDADSLFGFYSDSQVMRYWSTPPWPDIGQARDLIKNDIRALKAGEYLRLAVAPANEAKMIGACSLFDFNQQCRRAEVGYILARDYWGKGIMTEALSAILDFAFHELDLNRIEADVDPRNLASTKLLARLGFVREGALRERWIVGEEICDSYIFGLLKRDWRAA